MKPRTALQKTVDEIRELANEQELLEDWLAESEHSASEPEERINSLIDLYLLLKKMRKIAPGFGADEFHTVCRAIFSFLDRNGEDNK